MNSESASISFLQGGREGLSLNGTTNVDSRPIALARGRFDSHALPDLVVLNQRSNTLFYLPGAEHGFCDPDDRNLICTCGGDCDPVSRGCKRSIAVGESPYALALGEFNDDGFLDVVVARTAPRSLLYLHGDDDGLDCNGSREQLDLGTAVQSMTAGDFNGDSVDDLVAVVQDGAKARVVYLPARTWPRRSASGSAPTCRSEALLAPLRRATSTATACWTWPW